MTLLPIVTTEVFYKFFGNIDNLVTYDTLVSKLIYLKTNNPILFDIVHGLMETISNLSDKNMEQIKKEYIVIFTFIDMINLLEEQAIVNSQKEIERNMKTNLN